MKLLKTSLIISCILFLAATVTLAQGRCSFSCYRLLHVDVHVVPLLGCNFASCAIPRMDNK